MKHFVAQELKRLKKELQTYWWWVVGWVGSAKAVGRCVVLGWVSG